MKNHETKRCLYCNNNLKGRADKKFCDDRCRAHYNNRLKNENASMRRVNGILRKNRKLLESCFSYGVTRTKTDKKSLSEVGYNFSYCTHIRTNRRGTTFTFCYEYGFCLKDGDILMLVKRGTG